MSSRPRNAAWPDGQEPGGAARPGSARVPGTRRVAAAGPTAGLPRPSDPDRPVRETPVPRRAVSGDPRPTEEGRRDAARPGMVMPPGACCGRMVGGAIS
jgi:hypothetical protein